MSGYLANLLTRSFTPSTEGLQPRVNGLFAPPEKLSAWAERRLREKDTQGVFDLPDTLEHASVPGLESSPSAHRSAPAASLHSVDSDRAGNGQAAHTRAEVSAPMDRTRLLNDQVDARTTSPKAPRKVPPSIFRTSTDTVVPRSTIIAKPKNSGSAAYGSTPRSPRPEEPVARFRQSEVTASMLVQAPSFAPIGVSNKKAILDRDPPTGEDRSESRSPQTESSSSSAAKRSAMKREESRPVAGTRDGSHLRTQGTRSGLDTGDAVTSVLKDPLRQEARNVFMAFPVHSSENHAVSNAPPLTFRREALPPRRTHPELQGHDTQGCASSERKIEVTIGRIEVVGVVPAEPRRRLAQSSRGSSLEEYLRRRSGRSRE
jgi:hypothetical protein